MKFVEQKKTNWLGVGCHPTPNGLVKEFADRTTEYLDRLNGTFPKQDIRVLDLFSGDGRLGESISNRLKEKVLSVTYIDVDLGRLDRIKSIGKKDEIINANVFFWKPRRKFDLIVSNPPYQIINANICDQYGMDWDAMRKHSKNLYSLGIIKALGLLAPGGVLAAIAPFSWLRGVDSANFRNHIRENCSQVIVRAHKHRNVFAGTNQDTGIQIFRKKPSTAAPSRSWKFGYSKSPLEIVHQTRVSRPNGFEKQVINIKVGPIVWNRELARIGSSSKNALPLVYGGNIAHNGDLQFETPRYRSRQYIRKSDLKGHEVFSGPMILIRRVMRGHPGRWKIDSCVKNYRFKCTVENHVIVITFQQSHPSLKRIRTKLLRELKRFYYESGSPSISTKVVKSIMERIWTAQISKK
jgi:hypothetical protein